MPTHTETRINSIKTDTDEMEVIGERVEEVETDEQGNEINRVIISEWGVL